MVLAWLVLPADRSRHGHAARAAGCRTAQARARIGCARSASGLHACEIPVAPSVSPCVCSRVCVRATLCESRLLQWPNVVRCPGPPSNVSPEDAVRPLGRQQRPSARRPSHAPLTLPARLCDSASSGAHYPPRRPRSLTASAACPAVFRRPWLANSRRRPVAVPPERRKSVQVGERGATCHMRTGAARWTASRIRLDALAGRELQTMAPHASVLARLKRSSAPTGCSMPAAPKTAAGTSTCAIPSASSSSSSSPMSISSSSAPSSPSATSPSR